MTSSAPAKINLSLRVLGKREDGFHELQTRMAPIGLADEIEVRLAKGEPGIVFHCNDPSLPTDSSNLAVAAAEGFLDAAGLRGQTRLVINLEKKVPAGAGLGGGSSDAATVLQLCNKLHDSPLELDRLAQIGAELGSDVPFFLYGCVCDATGRGEIITPVEEFAHQLPLLLAKPGFGVPTPWAYQSWADSREIKGISYDRQLTPWGEMINGLERPVFEKYLQLADLKMWFLGQAEVQAAMMSGSGATVYAVLRSEEQMTSLHDRARKEFGDRLWLCPTRTL